MHQMYWFSQPVMIVGDAKPRVACNFLIQHNNVQRKSSKHIDVRYAALECFGRSTKEMQAWNLSSEEA